MLDEIFVEVSEFEAHLFVAGYRGFKVEIFDVDSHELGSWVGYNTVEEEIYCEEI